MVRVSGWAVWLLALWVGTSYAQSPCPVVNSSTDLTISSPCYFTPGMFFFRNLVVSAKVQVQTAASSCNYTTLNINGSFTLTATGSIQATTTNFSRSNLGLGVSNGLTGGSGGTFGGLGGSSTVKNINTNVYGTAWATAISSPLLCGSAGGSGSLPGGLGGGAVNIILSPAASLAQIDGLITANGGDATGYGGGGGTFLSHESTKKT